jgi:hypothetical protein
MNLLKLALVIAIGAGAYNYWKQHRHEGSLQSAGSTSPTSPTGFVSLPAVRGRSPSAVLVVAAEDCPHEDAQRADRLADDLSRNGLPVVRTHSVGFDIPNGGQADLDNINRVMTGQLPVVFVRGRAKANPTLDEVVAEFRSTAQ